MIDTREGDHQKNMAELLDYLYREMNARDDLAVANLHSNPERARRDRMMATHYRRMYEAAQHYQGAAAK